MTNNQQITFLQIIKGKGSTRVLLRQGLNYTQIALVIEELKNDGLICVDEHDKLILTEAGEEKIIILNKHLARGNSSAWISPLDSERVDKIEIDAVYLPHNKKYKE